MQNSSTDSPLLDPDHPRPGEGRKPVAPAAQGVGPTPRDVADRPLPTAAEIDDAMRDGSGDAVSAQPFDTEPADLDDARERVAWDADTERD